MGLCLKVRDLLWGGGAPLEMGGWERENLFFRLTARHNQPSGASKDFPGEKSSRKFDRNCLDFVCEISGAEKPNRRLFCEIFLAAVKCAVNFDLKVFSYAADVLSGKFNFPPHEILPQNWRGERGPCASIAPARECLFRQGGVN